MILGGYGNFGKRIAESLCKLSNITLLLAGRNSSKAEQLCRALHQQGARATLQAAALDISDPFFSDRLKALSPDLLIHTGGPFQGQDYRVPEACITAGCHYIDLADDRRFVCDIKTLDQSAKDNNVLIVSGASSVPGLSSTVIDHYREQFTSLDDIDFAIAPGNQAERGEATVRAILSYTGHPFPIFQKGQWTQTYGWMSPSKRDFGPTIGKRWLADIDIPDLELFPERYSLVNNVRFQAGLELPFLHLGMVLMAWLVRIGLVKNWASMTKTIFHSSELFKRLGTDTGGMQIQLSGTDKNHQPQTVLWTLCAEKGVGPYIPTLSAIILAKKLISGELQETGAKPCLGLYTLREFDREAKGLGIYHHTEVKHG
ncbi:saccharopine dehydrogenase NADP-binding domain-containing protein [Parendozoicomonas haliclonae]|uniref:Saccharopine dehydrogenase n=1 Tax=Parendozoicomonas haliclonae TaxID=1960125 RepID=A0A1X7AFB4_9GAMM|nr:Saccharopine dehydrogenase [Parendozoicomonas haliclonae]